MLVRKGVNDMIEIIYNKEKDTAVGNEEYFCVPRNIRQVGQPSETCKIYVEDYVYSFLAKHSKEEKSNTNMAILLGKSNWKDGVFYIFVKSSLTLCLRNTDEEYLAIKDEVWGKIYEEMKQYFPNQEVVGWYLNRPGGGLAVTDMIKKVHLTHFGGNDKVLYLADTENEDNGFFVYRNGKLERQQGYYIFYEKNEAMQEYILEKSPKLSVDYTGEPQDLAVHDFRKMIAKKRVEKEARKTDGMFRMITSGAAVAVLVLGLVWAGKTSVGVHVINLARQKITKETKEDLQDVAMEDERYEMAESSGLVIGEEVQTYEDGMQSDLNLEHWGTETKTGNLETEEVEAEPENQITEDAGAETASRETVGAEMEEAGTKLPDGNQEAERPAESGQEVWDTERVNAQTVVSGREYIIRQGDTLTSISINRYGDLSKIEEICKLNNMSKEDVIYEGQKILLP